jgi:hypothetical protein
LGVDAGAVVTMAGAGELAGRDTPLRDSVEVMLLNPMEGGAAAAGEATTHMNGGAAAAGEATTHMNGG